MSFSKWFGRRTSADKQTLSAPASRDRSSRGNASHGFIEPLEARELFAADGPRATSIYADNRGGVHIRFDKDLNPSTVTRSSVKLILSGTDGVYGTPDDIAVSSNVSYNKSKKTIDLIANVQTNVGYHVKLYSSLIADTSGLKLDGEFNGSTPSGNGTQGGNLVFRVKRDTSANPVVRMSTNEGDVDVKVFRGATSTNVATPDEANLFMTYANSGNWDNIFITRSAIGFVMQTGGLKLDSNGLIHQVPDPNVVLPSLTSLGFTPGNSNIRGTLAFGHSNDPTLPVNEFFVNTVNNDGRSGVDLNSQGFTVFGSINSKGMKVIDAISNLPRINIGSSGDTGLSNVPVKNLKVTGETVSLGGTPTTLPAPLKDFVVISRVAVLMKVVAA